MNKSMAQPSKVVYVGSIPYDQTEEQLLDVFRSVGNVINIRLVLDRETGKSKGFAFVEYHDIETAASAVRNLSNYPIGNRKLRVDFSHETTLGPASSNGEEKTTSSPHSASTAHPTNGLLPDLPKGKQLSNNQNASDFISEKLGSMDKSRILQIITDLKSIINNNPHQAQELLDQCPQLSFATVQSMLLLGLVDTNTVQSLVQGADPATVSPQQQQLSEEPTPEAAAAAAPAQIDPDQAALIKQVIAMPLEDVNNLPPDQREQVLELRRRVESGEIEL